MRHRHVDKYRSSGRFDLSIHHRQAIRREVLPDMAAALLDKSEEAVEVTHRAGRQIVQHHQAPGRRRDLSERAVDPAVRVLPVARQRAPQHDCRPMSREMRERRLRQQAVVEIAALSIWPEEPVWMGERADVRLRAVELGVRRVRRHQPERQRVAPGVIADPVVFGIRAFGERTMLASRQLLPDDEERRLDTAPRQHVADVQRHIGRRAVVEREVRSNMARVIRHAEASAKRSPTSY